MFFGTDLIHVSRNRTSFGSQAMVQGTKKNTLLPTYALKVDIRPTIERVPGREPLVRKLGLTEVRISSFGLLDHGSKVTHMARTRQEECLSEDALELEKCPRNAEKQLSSSIGPRFQRFSARADISPMWLRVDQ
jgi:hypothetical protein